MSDSRNTGQSSPWTSSCKRPLLAAVMILTTLGSVSLYAYFVRTLPPLPAAASLLDDAAGKFDVEITLTFDARADSAFVLRPMTVLVQLAGTDLLRSSQDFEAGRPVVIENVPDVKVGENEFWIQVHAGDVPDTSEDEFSSGFAQPLDDEQRPEARAVRVRIYRDGLAIAEASLWSEPGEPVQGELLVDVPKAPSDDHDH